jgi:hypothetical protein
MEIVRRRGKEKGRKYVSVRSFVLVHQTIANKRYRSAEWSLRRWWPNRAIRNDREAKPDGLGEVRSIMQKKETAMALQIFMVSERLKSV